MVIEELGALSFRNYQEVFVRFSERINVFVGANGQGKSNLAEAIYFLNHLDSFRTHRLAELITFGGEVAYVQGTVRRREDEEQHKARIELSRRGRRVWLDEEHIPRLSTYAAQFYALLFNPDHLYIYRHFPAERRAFFDRFLSFQDPEYLEALRSFRTVLSQKNGLLKRGELGTLPEWNHLFLEHGFAIINKRRELVQRLNEMLPRLRERVTGQPTALQLRYRPSLKGDRAESAALLERNVEQEARAGHALHGPQRDDFEMRLGGEERGESFFSQGEYRISLLALKLALNELVTERMGFCPVIILDDLFSELDSGVKERLAAYLRGVPNQIFITTTEPLEHLALPDARVMEIREGRIA